MLPAPKPGDRAEPSASLHASTLQSQTIQPVEAAILEGCSPWYPGLVYQDSKGSTASCSLGCLKGSYKCCAYIRFRKEEAGRPYLSDLFFFLRTSFPFLWERAFINVTDLIVKNTNLALQACMLITETKYLKIMPCYTNYSFCGIISPPPPIKWMMVVKRLMFKINMLLI